jgi:hypothetical protein
MSFRDQKEHVRTVRNLLDEGSTCHNSRRILNRRNNITKFLAAFGATLSWKELEIEQRDNLKRQKLQTRIE